MVMTPETREMTAAMRMAPEMLRALNELRFDFPDSKLLYVKVGDKEFGSNPVPAHSVDLIAEHHNREQEKKWSKFWKTMTLVKAKKLKRPIPVK